MDSEGEYHKKKPYQMGETLNSHQSFNTKPYVGRVMYEGNGREQSVLQPVEFLVVVLGQAAPSLPPVQISDR